jgi:hypothetical protein
MQEKLSCGFPSPLRIFLMVERPSLMPNLLRLYMDFKVKLYESICVIAIKNPARNYPCRV